MTTKPLPFMPAVLEDHEMILNRRELTSVNALLAYAAHEHRIDEERLRETLARRFGVADVDRLPGESYDEVIRFLVDMQASMILN